MKTKISRQSKSIARIRAERRKKRRCPDCGGPGPKRCPSCAEKHAVRMARYRHTKE